MSQVLKRVYAILADIPRERKPPWKRGCGCDRCLKRVEEERMALQGGLDAGGVSTGRDENVVLDAQGGGLYGERGFIVLGGLQGGGGSLGVGGGYIATKWMQVPEEGVPRMGGDEIAQGVFTTEDIATLARFAEAAPSGPARDWLYGMVAKAEAARFRIAASESAIPEPPTVEEPAQEVKPLDLELITVG